MYKRSLSPNNNNLITLENNIKSKLKRIGLK